uniref:Secreted protein n=1 Tax=Steinernema glaseri TaxID=37863 RepID=A0A1I7Y390_9BILA
MRLSVICVALILLCHVVADPEEVPAELDRNGATEDPHVAEEPKKDVSRGEPIDLLPHKSGARPSVDEVRKNRMKRNDYYYYYYYEDEE